MVPTDPQQPQHERQTNRTNSPNATGRLRSACDSCHQAKVRCSGANPCLTCQMGRSVCTYSPGSQPGRPKGSKNKRSSAQPNKNKRTNTQLVANDLNWPDPDLGSPVFSEDLIGSPNVSHVVDSMGDAHMHMTLEDDINALIAQTFTDTFPQSSYCALPVEAPESSGFGGSQSDFASNYQPFSPDAGAIQTSNGATMSELEECSCLQQLIQIVYRLGDLQYFPAGVPAIDSILSGVESAEIPWKSLRQCGRCQTQQNRKEVFLLFAMSIRILLTSLRKTYDKLHSIKPLSEVLDPSSPYAEIEVAVGTFKLRGETKAEVVDMVVQKILRSIASSLNYLQDRVRRFNDNDSDGTLMSADSIFSHTISDSQPMLNHCSSTSSNLLVEDIETLLHTLQSIMQTMGYDSKASAKGSLPRGSESSARHYTAVASHP